MDKYDKCHILLTFTQYLSHVKSNFLCSDVLLYQDWLPQTYVSDATRVRIPSLHKWTTQLKEFLFCFTAYSTEVRREFLKNLDHNNGMENYHLSGCHTWIW